MTTMTEDMLTRWARWMALDDPSDDLTMWECTKRGITISQWKEDVMTVYPTATFIDFKDEPNRIEAYVDGLGEDSYVGCWEEYEFASIWLQ